MCIDEINDNELPAIALHTHHNGVAIESSTAAASSAAIPGCRQAPEQSSLGHCAAKERQPQRRELPPRLRQLRLQW